MQDRKRSERISPTILLATRQCNRSDASESYLLECAFRQFTGSGR